MRTLEWDSERQQLKMIDQRLLPGRFEIVHYSTFQEVAQSIRDMVVRGAPAIGVSAAFGLALAGFQSKARDVKTIRLDLTTAGDVLRASRPTAVNLAWAVDRVLADVKNAAFNSVDEVRVFLLQKAQEMADEDVAINRRIATYGAELIEDGDTIIHHCNTGALATVDWGTALGVIRMAHELGKKIHVLVDETRPRLQGSRLTAWELQQYGIPYEIITDNAAGYMLRCGRAQKVLFGADRVAANGDVANKIGSYMLALAAFDNEVPVFSVFPTSTVDFSIPGGQAIPIEERDAAEVLNIQINGEPVAPVGAKACNPAFDVTPHRLLTGLITDRGIVYPPFSLNLPRVIRGA
jgi:methylthioribose-1-phosphate isomerase